MGKRTFIYKEADAQALQDAFTKMASDLRTNMRNMQSKVDSDLSGWSPDTETRQAQQKKGQEFSYRSEALTKALEDAASAVEKVRDLAHKAEVDNVALLD